MELAHGVKPAMAHSEMLKDRVGNGLGATAGALCTPCGVDQERAIVGPPTPDVWVTS